MCFLAKVTSLCSPQKLGRCSPYYLSWGFSVHASSSWSWWVSPWSLQTTWRLLWSVRIWRYHWSLESPIWLLVSSGRFRYQHASHVCFSSSVECFGGYDVERHPEKHFSGWNGSGYETCVAGWKRSGGTIEVLMNVSFFPSTAWLWQ